MKITALAIPDVLLVQLDVHRDERGWFQELWNPARSGQNVFARPFVQDNAACSRRGVLRGLHFQLPRPQGKLVIAVHGEIFDVAVDVRPDSATFGQWTGITLTAGSGDAVFVPEGFAHGYQALSENAHVLYKCTDYYDPACEHTLAWDDVDLAIPWPLPDPIISQKDRRARTLAETHAALAEIFSAQ